MWDHFFIAIALLLIFEGALPFLHPQGMKRTMQVLIRLNDGQLRTIGAISMLLGAIALFIIN